MDIWIFPTPNRSAPSVGKRPIWSATDSPSKPSMESPVSTPNAPTLNASSLQAATTGALKTASTTFATSPSMKIAPACAGAPELRSWPPYATWPYPSSVSLGLPPSLPRFATVLDKTIPSSFASSGCDFDGTLLQVQGSPNPLLGKKKPPPQVLNLQINLPEQNESI